MAMVKYTPEQADVLEWFMVNTGMLLVAAGAGTGKSFMAKQIALALQPVKGLYTAFNKAIVVEGRARFRGTNMECRTLHALALNYVKPYLQNTTINELSYTCITENLPYSDKYEIIRSIDMFFVSASTDMYEFMEKWYEDHTRKEELKELAVSYIDKMIAGSVDPTFNFLLKYFHLMLVEGTIVAEYDLVILDEINDTTAVSLEIFKEITAKHKLGLGETHQAIYQFLNLVNGFEELSDAPVLTLSQSFRCSEEIAESIQTFMQKEVTEEFKFIGTDEPVRNGKALFCTNTNAMIISEIYERMDKNKGFNLLRKVSEIFSYPMAIVTAAAGREPYNRKYRFLVEEYENYARTRNKGYSFFQHLMDNVGDRETESAVRLLLNLRRRSINLFDLYKSAKEAPTDLDYTIATVFTAKGLEFEKVIIADDLNSRITAIRDNGGIRNEDDLVAYRCYYVACSRAGVTLKNAAALLN